MKDRNYPIILGHQYRKGVMAVRNYRGLGGYAVLLCRLKKDYQTGEVFGLEDVKSVETELVFTEREALEITVRTMNKILDEWKEQEEQEGQDAAV